MITEQASNSGDVVDTFPTIPDVPIQPDTGRVNPNQIPSGTTRGTQTYMNTDGSYMTMGLIPNSTDFGIAFFDASGTLISKITGSTQYVYDKTTGKNIMQIGKLPDNTYGWAVAKVGNDVKDGFSTS
jgi:hypothetical protein